MKRIRNLGLIAVMALALTATAGVASAFGSAFEAPEGAVELKGKAQTIQRFVVNGGQEFKCGGSFTDSTTQATSETLTTNSLAFQNCNVGNEVKTNGCQLTFDPKAESSPGTFEGAFAIGPPSCGPMTVTYAGSCNVTISPTTGKKATFTNSGVGAEREVKIALVAEGLTYTNSCGGGGSNGVYEGTWEMEGYNGGKRRAIKVSPSFEPGPGIHVESGAFAAEGYPRPITGTQSPQLVLTTPGGEVKCTGTLGGKLTSAASALPLTTAFSSCTAFGLSATVAMKSCGYTLQVAAGGPPFTGTASIACSKEGDEIAVTPMMFGFPVCTMTVPPQALGSVGYENLGSGKTEHVLAKISGSGIKYQGSSSVCNSAGWHTDGTFKGGIDLVGTA